MRSLNRAHDNTQIDYLISALPDGMRRPVSTGYDTLPMIDALKGARERRPAVKLTVGKSGHQVIVANARNVQLITESTRKDDRLDARTLERLARIDPKLLSPVRHRSAQAQIHPMVIRPRATLISAHHFGNPGSVSTYRSCLTIYSGCYIL
jgi:hypothetical protein